MRQHPGVLAPAAALHRYDRVLRRTGNARQPARHRNKSIDRRRDVGAQRDPARFQALVQPHRGGRELHLLLTDVGVRPGAHRLDERGALGPGQTPTEKRFTLRADERRLDHHFLQALDDELLFLRLPAPPGGHAGQLQFLAQQMPAQPRQEREQGRAFHQSRAKRIRHRDLPGPSRLDQSRHAKERIAAQLDRIAERVIHAAEDHIHRLQSLQRLEENPPVAHGQIAALHQREAKIARHVGVLEIRLVVRAGRQQHDVRIVPAAGRQRPQRVTAQLIERRQPLHVAVAKLLRQNP